VSPLSRVNGARSVALSSSGEQDELRRLFQSEAPRLHRYFHRKTGNNDAAADLVQDTFVNMAARPPASIINPAAYLQRIARNLLVDCFRKRRRFENDAIPLDECDVTVPPLQEEMSRYRQAIDGLSEKTRVVFLFQRVHGLTYKEISHKLGISVSTVEYHMMRALVHIDQALEEL
jgi:RNA polymerase sigma factor (sigma-70 family)